jgi:UDP-glucose 4-epimerase
MNKACIFGGSGFLGSHVADCLVDDGYSVTIFDRQPSAWLKDGQEMVVGDLLSLDEVNEAVAGADVVYNFAALSDLNEGLDKPLETIRINILGNAHVMDACRSHNVSRFIYASTVYVNSRDGGFYRCSKQAAEHYVEEYQRVFGLDFTILRYGSLYGPRADKANGLYRIVKNAVESGSVSYQGSPEALREYIHVVDAAHASVAALGKEFRNQSVVLTGQEPMRVDDLLKMLAEILGYEGGVEFLETKNVGHYVRTPYAYQPKIGRKYIAPMHVDLGQGLIQLIDQIHTENFQG